MDKELVLHDLDAPQQIAIGALLVVAAIRDGEFAKDEAATIKQLFCEILQLDSLAAEHLLDEAYQRVSKTTSLQVLLGKLKYTFTLAQKQILMLMLMKVIAADGKQTSEEIEIIAQVKENLLISDTALHEVYERYFADHHLAGLS